MHGVLFAMLISGIQGFKNSFPFKSGEIMSEKLTEEVIVDKIIDFMLNKVDGNWHEEKVGKSDLRKSKSPDSRTYTIYAEFDIK